MLRTALLRAALLRAAFLRSALLRAPLVRPALLRAAALRACALRAAMRMCAAHPAGFAGFLGILPNIARFALMSSRLLLVSHVCPRTVEIAKMLQNESLMARQHCGLPRQRILK